jgi:O-antigen ligase
MARAVGTLPHPNNFGAFLFFSTLASFYFFLFSQKKLFKIFLTVFLFFQIFAIFLSFSRAALFALILGFSFFFIYALIKGTATDKKNVFKLMLTLICAGTLSLGLLYDQYYQRGGVVSYDHAGAKKSDSRRMYYFEVSYEIFKKHPFLGIGFFNYEKHHPKFITPEIRNKYEDKTVGGIVHSIYFLIASEEGLFALVCFLGFIAFLIYRFFALPFLLERTLFFSFFMGMLFIGLCDFPYIYMPQGRLFFFLVPALYSAVNLALDEKINKKASQT